MKQPKHRRSLLAFREHYHLTQQFVADQIGLDDTTIYRFEKGLLNPRPLTRKAIERFMDEYEASLGQH